MPKAKDYAELTSKPAKMAAIQKAKSTDELDAMWSTWEKQGWSKDGLLYSALLEKKQALGGKLPEGDLERIETANAKRAEGAKLPPITGKKRGG